MPFAGRRPAHGEAMPLPPRRHVARQLAGFSLTTAEILYRLPDYPSLLQTYVWQDYDVHPSFPRLSAFLDFWSRNLDGRLFRVTITHRRLLSPAVWRLARAEFSLH
jgi:uncharacterized protein Usg